MDDVQDRRGQGHEGDARGLCVVGAWPAAFLRRLWHRTSLHQRENPARIIDVQSATYDDPDVVPARMHIQIADRIGWMEEAHELPKFERYPPQQ
jgi:hypothetical protein